jgi:hypothetical protein
MPFEYFESMDLWNKRLWMGWTIRVQMTEQDAANFLARQNAIIAMAGGPR